MIIKQKNTSQAKTPNNALREHVNNLITLLLLACGSLGIFFSLISYNPFDSSCCFATTVPAPLTNWMGTLGAQCASLLLYLFGCSALLLPFILFFVLKIKLRKSVAPALKGSVQDADKKAQQSLFNGNMDRLVGLIFLLPLVSTLAHLYTWELYQLVYPGGLCGLIITQVLTTFLADPHVYLFLFMVTWATLVMIVRFSFITYLYPLLNLISKIPLKAACSFIITKVSAFLRSLIRRLTKQPKLPDLTLEDTPQTVFQEPAWQQTESFSAAYTSEKKEATEKAVPPGATPLETEDQFHEQLTIEPGIAAEGIPFKVPNHTLFPQSKDADAAMNPPRDDGSEKDATHRAATLEHKLERFGIKGKVVSITQGPVVTLFEYQPSIDTKISTIVAREDDLALALQALSLRIIAPIPGRSVIGFEVAHAKRRAVLFCHLLKSNAFTAFSGYLPLILGKDTLGNDVVIDLSSMPHLLVAGSTGSGKSVGLHTMIMSLLCSKSPDEIKFILIDPKRLEFAAYADIPHLLFPIVTDPARASAVLKWAVATMEDRYAIMAEAGVRNAAEYNSRITSSDEAYLPAIIIIIDELADLMMTAGKDVETLIARLAQMARAASIHLIVATQRPSVDVITGLIKVNFPSRIAYKVTSKVDSRTILDGVGAEKLLGKGDMLFLDTRGMINRVHGAFVTDTEISLAVKYIKAQRPAAYKELISLKNDAPDEDSDELFQDVLEYLKSKDEISISLIQRMFRIGYNRSARIMDQLESSGYILPSDGSKMRKVNKEL